MNTKNLFRYLCWVLVCVLLTSCEGRRTIVNGLDEREANEIVTYLSGKGVEVYKVRTETKGGGSASKAAEFDIQVPESLSDQATALLNQQGLPRKRSQNLLGIFSNSSLVPSEMQEKIRYQAGIADQIAGTIRKFDGVLDSDVTISFPQEDPLNPGQTKGKITASVYVKHSGVLDDPNSQLLSRIKRLVAAAVTGLAYDDVTVIPERARFVDTQQSLSGASLEDKQYVSIWSLVIAKESLVRFQVIFFSLSILILVLALTLIWIIWKVLPLLNHQGGIKSLFTIKPVEVLPPGSTEDANEENKASEKPPEGPGGVS
jgi:type III secretion protein J